MNLASGILMPLNVHWRTANGIASGQHTTGGLIGMSGSAWRGVGLTTLTNFGSAAR
jgi:hypothetical protein